MTSVHSTTIRPVSQGSREHRIAGSFGFENFVRNLPRVTMIGINLAAFALAFSNKGVSPMPDLAISPEKVGFLIEKAREFDAKEASTDPDSGSNASDDNMIDVLTDNGDDPVVREITGFINSLSEDEQIDLVALMRLGRGDGSIDEWTDLRREAAEGHNSRTASYLLGEPLLSDFLAEGLDQFGLPWGDERTVPVS
jgi:hypothetical protein